MRATLRVLFFSAIVEGEEQGTGSKDPPAEPEAFGCWPLKGALSQPLKSKSNRNRNRVAKQSASPKRKQQREVYSRNSQSSTATAAEPGDPPLELENGRAAAGDLFRQGWPDLVL